MGKNAIGIRGGSWPLHLPLVLGSVVVLFASSSCQRSGGDGSGGLAGAGGAGDRGGEGGSVSTAGGGAGGAAHGGDGATGQGWDAAGGVAGASAADGGVAPDTSSGDAAMVDVDGGSCPATIARSGTASPFPPDVLILFDRSGSMNEDLTGMTCAGGCGATSKWSVATAAVTSFLPMTEATINWGLKLFASTGNACAVSNTAEIVPGPMNAAAIAARLAATAPGSSTPTTAALNNAASYLKTFTDPNPKLILLVTDGGPTCGQSACAPVPYMAASNTCDDANAIAMVKMVHDQGIPVIVLGIGTSDAAGDATLSQMAINGGYPRSASPAYFPVDSGGSLAATFATISAMLDPCYLGLLPAPTASTDIASVTGDGAPIPNDAANGWRFAAMASGAGIQLEGAACASYKAGAIKTVKVDLFCR